MNISEIKPGYVYHIKDLYFEVAQDTKLMKNHEGGAYRPTYLCLKDGKTGLLWVIPMSSRIEKYKAVVEKDTVTIQSLARNLLTHHSKYEKVFNKPYESCA